MDIPGVDSEAMRLIVYPDSDPTRFTIRTGGKGRPFVNGDVLVADQLDPIVRFEAAGETLPARLVTALEVTGSSAKLPAECSLGISHTQRPAKRYRWSVCSGGRPYPSRIYVDPLTDLFGAVPAKSEAVPRLYSPVVKGYRETIMPLSSLIGRRGGTPLEEIFDGAGEWLAGGYGYVSLFSTYVGLTTYTSPRSADGSVTLEHSF